MGRIDAKHISGYATSSSHESVQLIDEALVREKALSSKGTERLREIHISHTGNDDTLQRMLNAIQPGSYIQPHRHSSPPKAEGLVLLSGLLGYVTFDDDGVVNKLLAVDRRGTGYEPRQD